MSWRDLPDALLVMIIVAGLSLLSVLLHQVELMLERRHYRRAAAAVGALRAFLTTDAPAVAARLASAAKGRPVAVPAPPAAAPKAEAEDAPPVEVKKERKR